MRPQPEGRRPTASQDQRDQPPRPANPQGEKGHRKEYNKHERVDGAQYGPAEKRKGHRDTEPAETKDHR